MNNNEDSKLKQIDNKIGKLKMRNVKMVEWRLTNKEREYIESQGYQIIPYIYEIRTNQCKNMHNIPNSIIREIYYANKAGKKTIGKLLKVQELKQLQEYGVKVYPVKFRVYLNN